MTRAILIFDADIPYNVYIQALGYLENLYIDDFIGL